MSLSVPRHSRSAVAPLVIALLGCLMAAGRLRGQEAAGVPGAADLTPADSAALAANAAAPAATGNATAPDAAPAGGAVPDTGAAPSDNAAPADNAAAMDATPLSLNQPDATDSAASSADGGLDRLYSLPPGAYNQQEANGIPYSSILTGPEAPDLSELNSIDTNPLRSSYSDPAKVGGAEGSLSFHAGQAEFGLPFSNAAAPDNANIKAGPFYIKFRSADGLVLYDDNYKRLQNDRKAETLVLLRLNLTIMAQLSENLQFSISGSIAYLPLQNQVGVLTPAYTDLGLLLSAIPIFRSQVGYDTMIGGWPVLFQDAFQANQGYYSNSVRNNFGLFQGDSLYEDQNGGYRFHSANVNPNYNGTNGAEIDSSVLYFSNIISALTSHDLPGDNLLTASIDHENLWYNQSNRGLPPGRDDFRASIVSQRQNLRFKPYVSYSATYIEGYPGVVQQLVAGFFGPIDDQLFINANAGMYINANGHYGELYQLILDHTAGPYTWEQLNINRGLSNFDQEQGTSEYYHINQILGPTINGSLFLGHDDIRNLTRDHTPNYTDYIGGLQMNWFVGPKTVLGMSGIFQRQIDDPGQRSDTATGRLVLNRSLSDTLSLELFYQYQRSFVDRPGDSYYENLVYLRLIKFL
jgi:hypothetical protein